MKPHQRPGLVALALYIGTALVVVTVIIWAART